MMRSRFVKLPPGTTTEIEIDKVLNNRIMWKYTTRYNNSMPELSDVKLTSDGTMVIGIAKDSICFLSGEDGAVIKEITMIPEEYTESLYEMDIVVSDGGHYAAIEGYGDRILLMDFQEESYMEIEVPDCDTENLLCEDMCFFGENLMLLISQEERQQMELLCYGSANGTLMWGSAYPCQDPCDYSYYSLSEMMYYDNKSYMD